MKNIRLIQLAQLRMIRTRKGQNGTEAPRLKTQITDRRIRIRVNDTKFVTRKKNEH